MKPRSALRCGTLLATWVCAGSPWAAPQSFNTALPIATGEFVWREQFVSREASDERGGRQRELVSNAVASVLGYGASGELALFGVLPYVDHRLLDRAPGGARSSRDSAGFGDLRLFARYTVLQRDAPGRTFRIAPFLGLEAPTGATDDRDAAGTLPASLQPGAGAWNLFVGLVATRQTLAYQVDAQLGYQLNTRADGFERGDEFRLDASVQYRWHPDRLGAGVPGFLYLVLESALVHRERNEVGGVGDPDSGGTAMFVAPGLQYVTRRWIIEGLIELPLVQNLNGDALEQDFVLRAGYRLNF